MTAARALPPRLANRLCSLLNEHAAACSLNDILDGNVAAITIVRRNPTASNARPHAPSPSRPLRRAGSPCFLEIVRGVQIPIAGRVARPLPRNARFRPLQLFGRRPCACGETFAGPASEKLNRSGLTHRSEPELCATPGPSGLHMPRAVRHNR
jgi:hypothetical protein